MATAPPTQAQALAAAVAAGVNQANAQRAYSRSQYLAQVLTALSQHGGENIRSPAQLGLNLLALAVAQHGKFGADRDVAGIQQQIAGQLYPNDRAAQLRWLVDPEGMNKSAAAQYAPIDVRQGNVVLNAPVPGGQFTAPILRDDGGVMGTQTPTGFTQTGQRAPNFQEQTAQLGQHEAARHNVASEGIENAKIPIELGMMNAALHNASTNAGQLGLSQTNSPNFAAPPGYVLDQAPGGR